MSKYLAIVDYGLGNLYSIEAACRHNGLKALITNDKHHIESASALILPGVGAFGDAMANLRQLDLVVPIRDFAQTQRPLWGICLGIQLLLSESQEFGSHKGLNIIPGEVVRLDSLSSEPLRVPQVGWNRLEKGFQGWESTCLSQTTVNDYFYFVHSFVAKPTEKSVILSQTTYVDVTFCSSLQQGNVFACQFHPERSGESGLKIYANLAAQMNQEVEHR